MADVYKVVDPEGFIDDLFKLMPAGADNELDRARVSKLRPAAQIMVSVLVQTGAAANVGDAIRQLEESGKRIRR